MNKRFLVVCLLAAFSELVGGATVAKIAKNSSSYDSRVRKSDKIIGGTPAEPHQFPYQVAVISTNGIEGQGDLFCGGSLISSKVVLTAAHCVFPYTASSVILGTNYALDENSDGYVKISISERTVHPNFAYNPLDYDIALLVLSVEVVIGANINFVLLPRLGTNENLVGNKGLVTGWGTTSDDPDAYLSANILWTEVPIVENQQCANSYGQIFLADRTVCAATEGGTVGPCLGDHGGAIIVLDQQLSETVQVGLLSFTDDLGCTTGAPTVYTKIASFVQWIADNGGPPVRN